MVNGVAHRDVTDLLYEESKYRKVYPTDKEWKKIEAYKLRRAQAERGRCEREQEKERRQKDLNKWKERKKKEKEKQEEKARIERREKEEREEKAAKRNARRTYREEEDALMLKMRAEGKTFKEIAEETAIPISTVWTRWAALTGKESHE